MLYRKKSAISPRAGIVDSSSSAAELPDSSFMEQFGAVDSVPQHHQLDLDKQAPQLLGEAYFPEDPFGFPPQHNGGVRLSIYDQDDANSALALDTEHPLKNIQDLSNGMESSSDTQHTTSSEQVPEALDQLQNPQIPQNDSDLNKDSQSEILDQDWEKIMDSLRKRDDIDALFGPVPVSESEKWDTFLKMTDQTQSLLSDPTTHTFAPVDPIDEFTTLSSVDDVAADHFQPPLDDFVQPSLTWNGPEPEIEETTYAQEVFPQALSQSIDAPPDSQCSNGDAQRYMQPRRSENTRQGVKNRRRLNIQSVDPSIYYQRLNGATHGWKPYEESRVIFQYNEYGNLCTDDKFSPSEILDYLYCHPLNFNEFGNFDAKNGRLTLWIQTAPADSVRRYPDKKSDKCRFADCPVPGGTIRTGFFRVAFDEQARSGLLTDPYHCAGFVHLFCLEKFCDFRQICQFLNVLPDERIMPEGKNKMAVTRDHEEMADLVRKFIHFPRQTSGWNYEQTLSFQLTSAHLTLQPQVRQTKRLERGGNHIKVHKGDLDKYMAGQEQKWEERKGARRAEKAEKPAKAVKTAKPAKRKRDTLAEEDNIANGEDDVTGQMCRKKRGRMKFR